MSIEQTREILSHEELSDADIVHLLGLTDPEECELLRKTAYNRTTELMGSFVYYRGLIEFSNICTASCRYCGIRRENHDVERYTMSKEEIVAAAKWAADQGYGSICLQSGERRDEKYIAFVESCLEAIHEATVSEKLPDGVGVTLSLGEQTIETYRRLAKASGNPSNLRYLARFETSNPELFKVLHGARGDHEKELQNRFRMLRDLREAGYQVGTGVMIGIPGQSLEDLCRDIRTFQQFDVDMIGMGPYLMSEGGELQEYGQMEPKALLQLALNMIAIAFLCANWIARTSYGRTIREIAVSNCIWAPLACWLSFSTLGNYGMGQELFHGLEVSSAINEVGSAGATLMVLQTLPFPKVAALVFLVLVFFNLATSATGSGLALSLYTAKGLGPRDEPDRRLTIFWCVLFLVMPVGILLLERAIPGLNVLSTIQSMITVSSIPVFFVLMALFIAFIRVIRADIRSGAVAKAVSPSRAWRWTDDAIPPEALKPASDPAKPEA